MINWLIDPKITFTEKEIPSENPEQEALYRDYKPKKLVVSESVTITAQYDPSVYNQIHPHIHNQLITEESLTPEEFIARIQSGEIKPDNPNMTKEELIAEVNRIVEEYTNG